MKIPPIPIFQDFPRYGCTGIAIALAFQTGMARADSSQTGSAKGITVYVAGDIADCREHTALQSPAAKTADLVANGLKGDAQARVLTLGDNTYPKGDPGEFVQCYAPTWGRFKDLTLPAPGNHDYYTAGAAGYFGYFGVSAGQQQRGYYRSQIGNWRIFSLNSNLKDPAQQASQLAWLQAELAKPGTGCTLAYWHHPLFSSGGHGNNPHMSAIWQALQNAKADLVLAGHDHDYERFAPQTVDGKPDVSGMREFVVGTGGTPLTPALMRRANSEVINTDSHGVLKLTLQDHGYDWEFLSVNKDGFADNGSATCH